MYSVRDDGTLLPPGFPIQKSPVQRMFGSSPGLIAAHHVFHRLPVPRHPPVALNNFFLFFPFQPYSIVNEHRDYISKSGVNLICKHMARTMRLLSEFDCKRTTYEKKVGGGEENRTLGLKLAKLALSQLSYTPTDVGTLISGGPGKT